MGIVLWIVDFLFRTYMFLILARVVVSYLPIDRYHPVVLFLFNVTEPVLAPVRRVLPAMGGLDFSPMVVLIVLSILEQIMLGMFIGVR